MLNVDEDRFSVCCFGDPCHLRPPRSNKEALQSCLAERGAEIRRLHQQNQLLLAACKIALPYLKTDDAREVVREAIQRAKSGA